MPHSEAQAKQALQALLADYDQLTPDDRKTMSEAGVVRQFVDRLLEEVLGWPIKDPARYKYELSTQAGRPDLTLIPEKGGVIFIEGKRFGVIQELKEARRTVIGVITPGQMALPGMAADRTAEEQQAINYAFENGGTWAILTNFEKLRLFNARRDWLVLSFERPYAYLTEFDVLWQLAYHNVLNGSLDVLSNLRYAKDIDTQYLDFINQWREQLAWDILRRREKNRWAFYPDGRVDLPLLRIAVQRFIDRLVIVRFAEDHLVIPPGTLYRYYDMRRNDIYSFYLDQFLENFFGKFDVVHNSALFAPHFSDEASFSDEALLPLIERLYTARYRSMPADIMGNTYEQYLGKTLVQRNGSIATADNLETRKKQGSYYTPQVIVRYIVDHSLGRYLYGTADGQPDGQPLTGESSGRRTAADIRSLRVLDGACGSGSFLIYAYQVLAGFYELEAQRLKAAFEAEMARLLPEWDSLTLDQRAGLERLENEYRRLDNYPRLILETHLYGVDLDPQAAEIAVVNLMMRAMEGHRQEKRLPLILGQNVKVGNSLIGLRPDDPHFEAYRAEIAELIRLRQLLTTDPDKDKPRLEREPDMYRTMTLAEAHQIPNIKARERAVAELQRRLAEPYELPPVEDEAHETYYETLRKTRALADKLDAELGSPFTDLERVRPFQWAIEFPEVFFDAEGKPLDNPGFTIVFGNPPWEIVKPDLREYYAQFDEQIESRLNRAEAEKRIAELDAENPNRRADFDALNAATEQSAAYYRRSGAYTRQGRGDTATHKLFLERMYGMLQPGGRIGYVVPSGIYTDLGTKDLREMLLNEGNIQYIFSFSNEKFFFSSVHHAFRFTLLGAQKGSQSDGFWTTFRFNPRVAVKPDDLPAFLANPANLIYIRRESLERFSPDSLSLMEFQTRRDYEIAEKVYDGWPLLGDDSPLPEGEGPGVRVAWNVKFTAEFHITNDRRLFNSKGQGLPLYEGKMIHQFDAFYAPPQYWLEEAPAVERLASKYGVKPEQLDFRSPRLAFRGIAAATNERTLIAAILPARVFSEGRTATTVMGNGITLAHQLFLAGCLNSFALDYILRSKVIANINMFFMYQLPIPRLTPGNPYFDAIVPRAARLTCTRPEFADLWREVMPDSPLPMFGEGSGVGLKPGVRVSLRSEIDAIVAHLYGLSRDEFDHILGTFPLVFPDTDEGRAKRAALLAVYDEWAGKLK